MNIKQVLTNLLTEEFDLGRRSDRWHGDPDELTERARRVEAFLSKNSNLFEKQKGG